MAHALGVIDPELYYRMTPRDLLLLSEDKAWQAQGCPNDHLEIDAAADRADNARLAALYPELAHLMPT
jgi:hypothetical protein